MKKCFPQDKSTNFQYLLISWLCFYSRKWVPQNVNLSKLIDASWKEWSKSSHSILVNESQVVAVGFISGLNSHVN